MYSCVLCHTCILCTFSYASLKNALWLRAPLRQVSRVFFTSGNWCAVLILLQFFQIITNNTQEEQSATQHLPTSHLLSLLICRSRTSGEQEQSFIYTALLVRPIWRGGGRCTQFVHGRSRMTLDPRIPTMPGRSTSGFRQPGTHCLHQARGAP